MSGVCSVCNKNVFEDGIACEACRGMFHPSCVQMRPSDAQCVKDVYKTWRCPACLQAGRRLRSGSVASTTSRQDASRGAISCTEDMFNRLLAEITGIKTMQQTLVEDISCIKNSQTALREEINEKYNKLHDDLLTCSARLSEQETAMTAHSASIVNIETRLARVEEGLRDAGEGSPSSGNVRDDSDMDAVISELNERHKRSRNIMIFGVTEVRGASKSERNARDAEFVAGVFSCLNVSVRAASISRVGKLLENRVRPVRVVMQHETDVQDVLRNARTLRDRDGFKHVIISNDQTPRQQLRYRAVRAELQDRTANGEAGLTIRTISGVPKIIKAKN